ncbi:hypothetical protein PHLCEN_2v7866 [Hermanssonia centrifuga]|uniref:F-box domain-containing protein n=1 Tax=Hermanssonia centrifuga TaxID=98765 RepID=A0A2R6NV74_9APHY|nr:hypothetical protein PHLCEN_2v7866 [Hermanssonia centrifuga]
MAAPGADIPEDLFERILDFLEIVPEGTKDKKSNLVKCALTCRYWARRCQPRIFEHIFLRSREDVDQLLYFLESSLGRISSYVKHLYLSQTAAAFIPWIHLVPLRLFPKLALSPTITLVFHTPWEESDANQYARFRSIHYMLPRAYPMFSSHISSLLLFLQQFRCFEDLAHLVGELHSLETFDCSMVQWFRDAPETYVVPACPPRLDKVTMMGCTQDAAGVLFLIGRRKGIQQNGTAVLPFRLDHRQHALACAIVCNLLGSENNVEFRTEKVDRAYSERTSIFLRSHH